MLLSFQIKTCNRQTNKQTNKQVNKQTNKQTNKQSCDARRPEASLLKCQTGAAMLTDQNKQTNKMAMLVSQKLLKLSDRWCNHSKSKHANKQTNKQASKQTNKQRKWPCWPNRSSSICQKGVWTGQSSVSDNLALTYRVFFSDWCGCPPKNLKYVKPRLGEPTST